MSFQFWDPEHKLVVGFVASDTTLCSRLESVAGKAFRSNYKEPGGGGCLLPPTTSFYWVRPTLEWPLSPLVKTVSLVKMSNEKVMFCPVNSRCFLKQVIQHCGAHKPTDDSQQDYSPGGVVGGSVESRHSG